MCVHTYTHQNPVCMMQTIPMCHVHLSVLCGGCGQAGRERGSTTCHVSGQQQQQAERECDPDTTLQNRWPQIPYCRVCVLHVLCMATTSQSDLPGPGNPPNGLLTC